MTTSRHAPQLVAIPSTEERTAGADAAPATGVQGIERERKELSDARRAAAPVAKRLLARAAAASCGQAAIARALDVRHVTVSRWLDVDDPAAMTLRDVLASPRSFARDVALLLQQQVDDATPALPLDVRLRRIGAEVGDVHRAALAGEGSDRVALAREAREAASELLALAHDLEKATP